MDIQMQADHDKPPKAVYSIELVFMGKASLMELIKELLLSDDRQI